MFDSISLFCRLTYESPCCQWAGSGTGGTVPLALPPSPPPASAHRWSAGSRRGGTGPKQSGERRTGKGFFLVHINTKVPVLVVAAVLSCDSSDIPLYLLILIPIPIYTHPLHRGYDEVGWSEFLPCPPVPPPHPTLGRYPDPVSQKLTFRRYNSLPADWQVRAMQRKGGLLVKALDCRLKGPEFQSHLQQRFISLLGALGPTPKIE